MLPYCLVLIVMLPYYTLLIRSLYIGDILYMSVCLCHFQNIPGSKFVCSIETHALVGKTDDPFCKTDIWYEILNMYMLSIRFSNRYLFWLYRGLIGSKNLDKTGF